MTAATISNHKIRFRPDLQGLRAIAILLVIISHTDLGMATGGFVGVDVFFVLSGYLITGLLLRELQQDGRIAFMSFYARRLKRLLPALTVMIVISSIVAVWLLSGVEARKQLTSAPYAATWTSNIYFTFVNLDYFDELANRDLFIHTWSLGVEEQFYLIWPALLLLVGCRGVAFNIKRSAWLIPLALGVALLASFTLSIYWMSSTSQAAFYLMPSRIWQFSLGALVYLLISNKSLHNSRTGPLNGNLSAYLLLTTGLVLIIGCALWLHPAIPYPGFWILAPSFGAAAVIAAGGMLQENRNGPLAHPLLVWIGDRSYSLYLWHWPIFVLGFSTGLQGRLLPVLGLVLLTIIASMISFRVVELPFWKGRYSHIETGRFTLAGILIMAVVVFALVQSIDHLTHTDRTTDISNQWRADVPIIYQQQCDAGKKHARVEPCIFGTEAYSKTVVLLGDSVGVQWFSLIQLVFPQPEWRVMVLTKSACPIVNTIDRKRFWKTRNPCTEWRNAVLDELDAIHPNVLIMGSASTYDFNQTQWMEGSAEIFQRLNGSTGSVIVLNGTPSLGFDGPGCLARHLAPDGSINGAKCVAKDRLQYIEIASESIESATNRFTNVHMLDLNDLVCPDGNCSAITQDGIIVFRDSQHLTDTYVKAQAPYVLERLREFIPDIN